MFVINDAVGVFQEPLELGLCFRMEFIFTLVADAGNLTFKALTVGAAGGVGMIG